MFAVHFANSVGLFISLLVVLMVIIGEAGLTVNEYLSEHAAKGAHESLHRQLSHRVSA